MVSERRFVVVGGGGGRGRANHVVLCPVLVEAADLGGVVDIELVEHVLDEVSDLDDGFIAERWQCDGVGVGVLAVGVHDVACLLNAETRRDGGLTYPAVRRPPGRASRQAGEARVWRPRPAALRPWW